MPKFITKERINKMVYIFLADGFEEIEALTQVDYLRRAGVEVITVGITGKTVTGAHNISVVCDITENDAVLDEKLEMVILPGGIPGVPNLGKSEFVVDALEYAYKNDKFIAAICAAPTLVAKYGYLEGKNAVCYPSMESELYGANCVDAAVVRDGKIITARAAGASEEFSFELIRALVSKDAAEKVRHAIYAR